jgi:hypothetical protein
MKSLGDEWRREYPNLETVVKFFEHRETQFRIEEITPDEAKAFAVTILERPTQLRDPIFAACEKILFGRQTFNIGFHARDRCHFLPRRPLRC